MESGIDPKIFMKLLDEIEDTLLDFEQRCLRLEGENHKAEMQVVFRAAHNIKGASQLYGLNEFGSFVHGVENLLNTLFKRKLPVDTEAINLLLKAHAFMKKWIDGLRTDQKYVLDGSGILSIIAEKNRSILASDQIVVQTSPPPAVEVKATKPVVNQSPPRASSLAGSGQPELQTVAPATSEIAQSMGPIEAVVTQSPVTLDVAHMAPQDSKRVVDKRRRAGNLRVPSVKIDEIMQLIGEFSINQSILWHGQATNSLNSQVCRNAIVLNRKVVKELQNLVLSLRMQPIESLFQRLERAARDIARQLGKRINVEFQGADVILDKTVIELMMDPMVHLVRNAIDHGIEEDADRERNGKSLPARLVIQAQPDAGRVLISVSDDGKGIDAEAVLAKALRQGLANPNMNYSANEIYEFIFQPGFSTRETVTEVSGRGVGLDVVLEAIEQLSGQVEIQTTKNMGTTFLISLPTSVEIIDGLVIRVGKNQYIVPLQDVVELINLNEIQMERLGTDSYAIRLREHLVPVESLADYMGTDDGDSGPRIGHPVAIVIRLRDRNLLALKVDQVVTQQNIVVRPLNDQLAVIPGFNGATILGNGEPGMILNMSYFADCYLSWISRSRKVL